MEAPAFALRGFSWDVILAAGYGAPMMRVDGANTSAGWPPSRRAVAVQVWRQARRPGCPVAQLALPEFTRTARTRPLLFASAARPTSTGAATMRFLVNRAAAVARGSARISARSGLPLALIPAVTAENLKPFGRKIGPDAFIRGASPGSLPVPEGWRSAATRL